MRPVTGVIRKRRVNRTSAANGDIQFVFNTPSGKGARTDEGRIRSAAVAYGVPCVTTLPGCVAVVKSLEALAADPVPRVQALQDWSARLAGAG